MTTRLLLLVAGWLLLGASLSAQEQAPEPAAEPAAESDSAGAAGDSAEAGEADDGDDEAEPLGAAEARAADDLSIFVPTREVPPDEQVLFPADI